jgi:hypothetical protein
MKAPKVTKRLVEQEIDLKEIFGVDFSGKPELREIIGERIIEYIRDRTESGEGVKFGLSGKGTPVKLKSPYSQAYVKSPDFKAFGKSRNQVNMRLTGDMLELMDVTKQTANTITIGWNDKSQVPKAYNHIEGDTVPSRPFFGVSKTEVKELASDLRSEIKEAIKVYEEKGRDEFDKYLMDLSKRLTESDSSDED